MPQKNKDLQILGYSNRAIDIIIEKSIRIVIIINFTKHCVPLAKLVE